MTMRKIAILAEGSFELHYGKTAMGVLRYSQDPTVAVIDSTQAGQDVDQVMGGLIGKNVPIVRDIHDALQYRPDTLLIGIAPRGGSLPDSWRWQLFAAIEAGLDIISGLHLFLSEDEALRTAARRNNVRIWDVRRPMEQKRRVAEFLPHRPGSYTILTVGTDCATGKMTTALELDRALRAQKKNSTFLASGQTGIMISGRGLPVDRLISDFAAGLVEEMVLDACDEYDWVCVEGQGAINHPGYSPVTLSLLHGANPDAMILCHIAGNTIIEGYPHCSLPSLKSSIGMYENAMSWIKPDRSGRVVGISLVTHRLSERAALEAIDKAEQETGLPTTDVIRFGNKKLINALSTEFEAKYSIV